VEGMTKFGYPASLAPWIGLVLLVSTIAVLIPRTAALGCILVTGYLGGAAATQVRVQNAMVSVPGRAWSPVVVGTVFAGWALACADPVAQINPLTTLEATSTFLAGCHGLLPWLLPGHASG